MVYRCPDLEVDMITAKRKYFRLKGCPRCKGDLLIDKAYSNHPVEICIQCGFHHYLGVGSNELTIKSNKAELSIN